MSDMATMTPHVRLTVVCASCHRPVDLECHGLIGFWGYDSYNEYVCPYCGKQNHALSSGAVISARASSRQT